MSVVLTEQLSADWTTANSSTYAAAAWHLLLHDACYVKGFSINASMDRSQTPPDRR